MNAIDIVLVRQGYQTVQDPAGWAPTTGNFVTGEDMTGNISLVRVRPTLERTMSRTISAQRT